MKCKFCDFLTLMKLDSLNFETEIVCEGKGN